MSLPLLPADVGGLVTGEEIALAARVFAAQRPDLANLPAETVTSRLQQRWGSTLTPVVLTTACRNADYGYTTLLADILDELRETDPHLHAVLMKREWQVAGAKWELLPAVEGDTRAAKAVEVCKEAFARVPYLPSMLAELMGAVYHGRAAWEVVWAREGKWWFPKNVLPVHPRRLIFNVDWQMCIYDPGLARTGHPAGTWPGVVLDTYPAGKFVSHTPRIRGGFTQREGLGRLLSWFAMFKRFTLRDAMALAEMAGRLGRIGIYKTGQKDGFRASPEDKTVLETSLRDWSSAISMVIPDTTDVRFEKPVTRNTIHEFLIAAINAEMSKAVLGETLTTEPGKVGSRSLGEVHAEVGLMVARGDAQSLAETLRRELLAPLVAFNLGPDWPVPTISFGVEPQESLDSLAQRVKILVEAGLDVEQAWVRSRFGIPEPSPTGAVLVPLSAKGTPPWVATSSPPDSARGQALTGVVLPPR